MCGIAGLFSKSSAIEERARRAPERDARRSSPIAGPTAPASPCTATRPRPGACKVSLFSPDAATPCGTSSPASWPRRSAAEAGPEVRASHALFVVAGRRRRACRRWLAERHPELRVMSVGERIEIYKEAVDPRDFVERFALADVAATPRARPHADGDREPGDDRALPPVLDRARPLPRAQRLALEPQPAAARTCAARGSSSRPTTTPRSRPAT